MIDEDHSGSARSVSVAEKPNLLAARSHEYRHLPSDLHQVFCDRARNPVERNYDDDGNALSRLDIRESLNGFRESARSRVRRELRGEMDDSDRVARR